MWKCPSTESWSFMGRPVESPPDGRGRCVNGGGALVFPVIQGHEFLDLTPMTIEIKLPEEENIRINTLNV